MQFRVTMKDPDTLHDAIQEAVAEEVEKMGLDEDEREAVIDTRRQKVAAICAKWFEYGEYLVVDIDTDKKTCVVVDQK